jgi:hypothetical protein
MIYKIKQKYTEHATIYKMKENVTSGTSKQKFITQIRRSLQAVFFFICRSF